MYRLLTRVQDITQLSAEGTYNNYLCIDWIDITDYKVVSVRIRFNKVVAPCVYRGLPFVKHYS
jgi:hypothetical protein